MPDRPESADRRRPDSLRRRIGRAQLGILRLDTIQLEHEPIVFGVRHLRVVEGMIAIVVPLQEFAQLRSARRRASHSVRLTPGAHEAPAQEYKAA